MDSRRSASATNAVMQGAPSLASELRHSALLFGLLAGTAGGMVAGWSALLKVLS